MHRLITFILFFISVSIFAQNKKPVKTTIAKQNSTIKKPLLSKIQLKQKNDRATLASFIVSADKVKLLSKPVGYTNDFEHVFTNLQIAELDLIIGNFEKETTNQIAIVTVDTLITTNYNFMDLILKLHNVWGVGTIGKNNGILIGISISLKKIRISNGYGIEKIITDKETKEIVDNTMIVEFKKGNYFEGTKKALLALMQKIRKAQEIGF